jgi:hypothetical protein
MVFFFNKSNIKQKKSVRALIKRNYRLGGGVSIFTCMENY